MADATYADLLGSDILLHYDASDASSLFTDTAATTAASDGNEVRAITPQAGAALSGAATGANGPTYHLNYSATGYPGLQFDGTNDVLRFNGTGLSVGQALFAICAQTWISGLTVWSRGGGVGFLRQFGGSSIQTSTGVGVTGTTGKTVCASIARAGQTAADSLAASGSSTGNGLSATLGTPIAFGAFESGPLTFAQYGAFVLHEVMFVAGTCEWGQVLRAAKIMRSKWGITDPNAMPQKPTGGTAGFTGIRGVSRRLGT